MRPTAAFAALTLFAILAACDREPKVAMKDASVADVAKKVDQVRGSDRLILPGKWLQSVQMEEFDVPGMPQSAQDSVRKTMASAASGHELCLTEADAKRVGDCDKADAAK